MSLKSDFEILVDLRKDVSRTQSFLVLLALLGTLAFAALVDSLSDRITELEASITKLKGQDDG